MPGAAGLTCGGAMPGAAGLTCGGAMPGAAGLTCGERAWPGQGQGVPRGSAASGPAG
jgi:hypothetical protein